MLDYKTGLEKHLVSQATHKIELPKSDVLQFYTEDGSKISVRPSGTEPKIKFYISVSASLKAASNFDVVNGELDKKIAALEKDIVQ